MLPVKKELVCNISMYICYLTSKLCFKNRTKDQLYDYTKHKYTVFAS